jgi:hypothetical protein
LSIRAGYLNKDIYDVVSLGLTVGRRFGRRLPQREESQRQEADTPQR